MEVKQGEGIVLLDVEEGVSRVFGSCGSRDGGRVGMIEGFLELIHF